MDEIKYAFFGTTAYSKELLLYLIDKDKFPKIIFSIPEEFNISYSRKKVRNSNYANLEEIAKKFEIPYFEVDSIEGKKIGNYKDVIAGLDLDLFLVLGWYYMIPKDVRELTRYGSWGIHASLLPKYAGGAPLNWAIIKGETETGVTLFRMEDGVDDGDIIAQQSFLIDFQDSIKEVYEKAVIASKEILIETLDDIDKIEFKPQKKDKIEVFPQRKPEDGELDLSKNSVELYNFIRAQSSPYPGAYIKTSDGKKLIIEKARIEA